MTDPFSPTVPATPPAKYHFGRLSTSSRLAVAVFVLVLMLLGAYWWQHWTAVDQLAKYTPFNAIVYFQAHDTGWGKASVVANLPYANFYQEASVAKLLSLSKATAYATFFVDNNLESIWLFQLKSSGQPINTDLPNARMLTHQILVVGSSPVALAQVEQVVSGNIFSLASQQSFNSTPLELLVSAANLKSYLSQAGSANDKVIAPLLATDLHWLLQPKNSAWDISFVGTPAQRTVANNHLVDSLPADFNFFISGINLSAVLSQWAVANANWSKDFQQTTSIYQEVFKLDALAAANGIFNAPGDLIIFTADQPAALGASFIAVLPQPSATALANFKQLVQAALAQQLPRQTLHQLPDGSWVVQLSADVQARQWHGQTMSDQEVLAIAEPALHFSLYYLLLPDQLVIANSASRLEQFLTGKHSINLQAYKQHCNKNIFNSTYIIFAKNSQIYEFSQFLPNKSLIVGLNNGCLLNF